MKLGSKIILGFSTVAVIAVVIGLTGMWGISVIKERGMELGGICLPSVQSMLGIKAGLMGIVSVEDGLANPVLSQAERNEHYKEIEQARAEYKAAMDAYEKIERTSEETAKFEALKKSIGAWKVENDKYFAMAEEFDKIDILNPDGIRAAVERFRGDHYRLTTLCAQSVSSGEFFDGGDDHLSCGFGKWIADYSTKNKALSTAFSDIRGPHEKFHATVKALKEAIKIGNKEDAAKLFTTVGNTSHEVIKHFESVRQEIDNTQQFHQKMVAQLSGNCAKCQHESLKMMDDMVAATVARASRTQAENVSAAKLSNYIMISVLACGIVAALLLGGIITRSIVKPIRAIISGLTDGAAQVASASGQVSAASQSLAEGATEQAAGLEETSSSLEEMSSMTRQSAENAQQAATLAGQSKASAANGAKAMAKMNEAINQIQKSSDSTAKIIKVIDEIAFQTNLLALNAAVEAARAGEAGKGFAVVAEEVRNLAMRSAEAAKNTAAMIEESVKNSKNGVDITNEVTSVLEEIVTSISKTADLVGEIAASSQEQAKGIDQVNTAVAQMDKVTQSNAANAEESASASEELNAQAASMNDIVAELVTLVGGSNANVQKKQSTFKKLGLTDKTFHAIAGGKNKVNTQSGRELKAHAKSILPLHDDDLKDFNS